MSHEDNKSLHIPSGIYFTESHEWLCVNGSVISMGVTDYAQEQMGDIVYIELPEVGLTINMGTEITVIESVKVAVELYAPVTGTIVEVNTTLTDSPEKINQDPLGEGWIAHLTLSDVSEIATLMTKRDYDAFLQTLKED